MLLHAHSDTRVHDAYRPVLESLSAEVGDGLRDGTGVVDELRDLWDEETRRVDAAQWGNDVPAFAKILECLPWIVANTKIVMDHYRSSERLDYDSGPVNVIAVGGNTLSRGLTLEGLVVSYFVRSSNMYDTLLQMGRWFGYRSGYEDLPRIYMPDETRHWFTHLATVEAEMRVEIDRYLVEHRTPVELAVRIRCHPKMRVTAPAKSRNAVRASASYGGQLVETRYFPCKPEDEVWHAENADAVTSLLQGAHSDGRADESVAKGRMLWRDVPIGQVLAFIDSYKFHSKSVDAERHLMRQYIERRSKEGALIHWNVGVMGKAVEEGKRHLILPSGDAVTAVIRTRLSTSRGAAVADIKTLTGSRDEALDLRVPVGEKEINRSKLKKWRVQQESERGLVLLYPIDAESPVPTRRIDGVEIPLQGRAPLDAPGEIVWGAAMVFPEPTGGSDLAVEYDFVQADLSRVFPAAAEDDKEDDADVLDQDQDADQ